MDVRSQKMSRLRFCQTPRSSRRTWENATLRSVFRKTLAYPPLLQMTCSRVERKGDMSMSTHADQNPNNQDLQTEPTLEAHFSAREGPLLEVRGLSTGYGETQVLWDISLDVMRGEVVAVIGANGAGKSTLLTTISGLLPSWKGKIVFAGRDITHYRAERIVKLGLIQVPQGRRLFGGL